MDPVGHPPALDSLDGIHPSYGLDVRGDDFLGGHIILHIGGCNLPRILAKR